MEPLYLIFPGLGPSCAYDLEHTSWVEIPPYYVNHAIINLSVSYRENVSVYVSTHGVNIQLILSFHPSVLFLIELWKDIHLKP